MARLSRADMEAALAFAAEVSTAASETDRADLWLLERISRLVGLEAGSYAQLETSSSRFLSYAEYPARPADGPSWTPTEHEHEVWLTQNPFCIFAVRTGDRYFSARRLTDVVDLRTFRQTEFFEITGARPAVQTRLPGEAGTHWCLTLKRTGANFTVRDMLLLDALRPFLMTYEAHRALAAKIAALQVVRPDTIADGRLSARENEVLDLVAGGAANAAIAERLWISPGTVRKHLEHIYLKLEVSSRTAALARTGRSSVAPDTMRT
ncbi:MAG TPA: helix-turn-helix transcriptional regulator [Candidatus Binatia bacterium]|nr:helix-turn-helix transcriptional regulator [Candidatus Binatia bacterium]